ncbi:hypothetical protein CAP39_14855 [Sphingomonas sp. IBVSS1]|nr:hypothetical protein CAP39_14855 [Sphingomonas sp. IBVSS1]
MFGVIAGVLIALLVNEAVSDWHKQQEVSEARQMVREEVRYNSGFYAYRVAWAPCLNRRIDQLEQWIEDAAAGRATAAFPQAMPITGGRLDDQTWQTLLNSGVASDFPLREIRLYSEIYSQQLDVREWLTSEGEDWNRLSLANYDPKTLDHADISAMRLALRSARRWSYLQELNDRRQVKRAATLKVGAPDFNEERFLILNDRLNADCAAFGIKPQWPKGFQPPANLPRGVQSPFDVSPTVASASASN